LEGVLVSLESRRVAAAEEVSDFDARAEGRHADPQGRVLETELAQVGAPEPRFLRRVEKPKALLVRPRVLPEAVAHGVERAADEQAVVAAERRLEQRARHPAPVACRN